MSPKIKRATAPADKAKREAAILAAALDLFARQGFHVTKMDDIAAAAQVSKGTLYLYFANKKALFRGLISHYAGNEIRRIRTLLSEEDNLTVLLSKINEMMVEMLTTSALPKLLRVLISESAHFPDMPVFYREQVIARILALWSSKFGGGEQGQRLAKLLIAPLSLSLMWQEFFFADKPMTKEELHQLIALQCQMIERTLLETRT